MCSTKLAAVYLFFESKYSFLSYIYYHRSVTAVIMQLGVPSFDVIIRDAQ